MKAFRFALTACVSQQALGAWPGNTEAGRFENQAEPHVDTNKRLVLKTKGSFWLST